MSDIEKAKYYCHKTNSMVEKDLVVYWCGDTEELIDITQRDWLKDCLDREDKTELYVRYDELKMAHERIAELEKDLYTCNVACIRELPSKLYDHPLMPKNSLDFFKVLDLHADALDAKLREGDQP